MSSSLEQWRASQRTYLFIFFLEAGELGSMPISTRRLLLALYSRIIPSGCGGPSGIEPCWLHARQAPYTLYLLLYLSRGFLFFFKCMYVCVWGEGQHTDSAVLRIYFWRRLGTIYGAGDKTQIGHMQGKLLPIVLSFQPLRGFK